MRKFSFIMMKLQ